MSWPPADCRASPVVPRGCITSFCHGYRQLRYAEAITRFTSNLVKQGAWNDREVVNWERLSYPKENSVYKFTSLAPVYRLLIDQPRNQLWTFKALFKATTKDQSDKTFKQNKRFLSKKPGKKKIPLDSQPLHRSSMLKNASWTLLCGCNTGKRGRVQNRSRNWIIHALTGIAPVQGVSQLFVSAWLRPNEPDNLRGLSLLKFSLSQIWELLPHNNWSLLMANIPMISKTKRFTSRKRAKFNKLPELFKQTYLWLLSHALSPPL